MRCIGIPYLNNSAIRVILIPETASETPLSGDGILIMELYQENQSLKATSINKKLEEAK